MSKAMRQNEFPRLGARAIGSPPFATTFSCDHLISFVGSFFALPKLIAKYTYKSEEDNLQMSVTPVKYLLAVSAKISTTNS